MDALAFPFLFGGAFIEALQADPSRYRGLHFPSFLEGLSLRRRCEEAVQGEGKISLPFGKGFH